MKEFPRIWENMSQLTYMVLSFNPLSGVIPRTIYSNATSLEHLMLSEIQLISEIPVESMAFTR